MSAETTAKKASKRVFKYIKKPGLVKTTNAYKVTHLPAKRNRTPDQEFGREIWVYNNLLRNNIVYSLTKALKNNAALRQIPFNGKKSVPAAIRKDLWHPFAKISLPPGFGFVGLSVYQKLREYRKRHELEWGDEMRLNKDDKERLEDLDPEGKARDKDPKKLDKAEKRLILRMRGLKLQDQRANSVADMAAVLSRLGLAAEKPKKVPNENGHYVWPPRIGLHREGSGIDVKIYWRDLTEAEYAESWGENIAHGELAGQMNSRKRLSKVVHKALSGKYRGRGVGTNEGEPKTKLQTLVESPGRTKRREQKQERIAVAP